MTTNRFADTTRVLAHTAVIVLVTWILLPSGWAQQNDGDKSSQEQSLGVSQSQSDSSSAPSSARSEEPLQIPDTSGSVARIVDFLRSHPNVAKQMRDDYVQENPDAAQQLALSGQEGSGAFGSANLGAASDTITERLRTDEDLRNWTTEWLTSHGYDVGGDEQVAGESLVQQSRVAKKQTEPMLKVRPQPTAKVGVATQPNNPYGDLPSLKDLYAQVPVQEKELKRFGADVFKVRAIKSGNMDLPAGPDYVLGPGDGINIDIWGGISQRWMRTVDREGRISLREAGSIIVSGLTLAQARDLIERNLQPQFRNAKVDVSLTRVRSVRVYVVGDVERPGAYDVSSLSTPLNALYVAGGPTARGSLRRVQQVRGEKLIRSVDLYDFLLRGIRSDVDRLLPGDTILVPPVGPQVAVVGMVRRPAIYELRNENELNQVIDLAGGLLVSATLRQVKVERIVAHAERVMVSLQLPENASPNAVKEALGSFKVEDGDRVNIAPILPYSYRTVYLEGHVSRPGKYPYQEGMQIGDLLKSYGDLLPEASTHAEIIRLVAPDYHPVTMEFNLDEVLDQTDPIELKPFDTVRIYGRYEADAPKVRIEGEVLRPGQYPLSKGMTATDLLRAAGGFKRSAYKQEAEIGSYVVENGKKILLERRSIDIAKALAGDRAANVVLKPGDELMVRNLSGWNEIGASVTLKGEVAYPGKYAIHEGERLSSLLKRAGGFRPEAYPAGAVLERLEVQQLERRNRDQLVQNIEAASPALKLTNASAQQQQVLKDLKNLPIPGRVIIRISPDVARWQNTPDDIPLRSGDMLIIPKRPAYVVITGQVFNSSAISFSPGKSARWYLAQAGGPTRFADKKNIFIIQANGSVIGKSSGGWFSGGLLDTKLQPGDSIVVPEKAAGGGQFWKNMLTTAQVISSIAITASVAASL